MGRGKVVEPDFLNPVIVGSENRTGVCAAFEPKEVVAQLKEAGLGELEVGVVSDRHLAIFGRIG